MTVRKEEGYFVYFDIDESAVCINRDEVNMVVEKIHDDDMFVAIILACIEYARRSINSTNEPEVKKINEDLIAKVIQKIYVKYSLEIIIDIIKDLKWHEICQIIKSKDPIEVIEEII